MSHVERVLLAEPRSFCAGVEMAIKALAWMVRISEGPVYCYHEIVHNQVVVEQFRRAGVVFVDDIDAVPAGAPLMLSAHGSAPEVVAAARSRTATVVDAVCPLVKKVHHEVRRRSEAGHTVIYAGHPEHDEAAGTMAVAPGSTRLVESAAAVAAVEHSDGPVAFLAQTTLAVRDWEDILAATRARFGDVWVPGRSDLCFATTNRQAAVEAIAPRCSTVVVVGSDTSSNTRALAQVAETAGTARVLRIHGPDELPLDLTGTVGVTAGASAPDELVDSVVARLAPSDGVEVVVVTAEAEYFPPPRELRDLVRSVGAEALLDDDRSVAATEVLRGLTSHVSTDAIDHVATYTAAIDGAMAAVVEDEVADPWLQGAIGFHLGWRDEHFETLPAGSRPTGKRLRPALALLCHRVCAPGGERPLPFAAGVELLHNWSLVHDDIEDGDRTRRGRPALWTICGTAQAINVGDCLYGLAFRAVHRLEEQAAELLADLARSAVEITVGQMRDLSFETAPAVDRGRYMEMIDGKTGALMGCATYGGALLGSGRPEVADAFGEFGRRLGLSFPIRDDVLGIWGLDSETGKPTGGDIRRRKKTLPLVLALGRAQPADRRQLYRLYAREGPLGAADVLEVRAILDRCGAQHLAQAEARSHRDAALAALDAALPDGTTDPTATAALATLRALADFVTERTY